jgi:DNA primase
MPQNKWINFQHIKQTVSIEDLLHHYGKRDKFRENGDQLTGFCPLPCHTGKGKKSPSFSVNTEKNAWQCFSCNKGGNIFDFVMLMEGLETVRSAGLWIVEHFPTAAADPDKPNDDAATDKSTTTPEVEQPDDSNKVTESARNQPITFVLKNLNQKHPYLKKRGLNPETIANFGIGLCNKGLMKGRIAIPIHNINGELVAYAGRAITEKDEADGKYKLPVGFKKELELFNLHNALPAGNYSSLIVVEGFFSVMWLHQCGFTNTIAIMGATLTTSQERLLTEMLVTGSQVTLLFDGDEAGNRCGHEAVERLSKHFYVHRYILPPDKQPDDFSCEQLHEILIGTE